MGDVMRAKKQWEKESETGRREPGPSRSAGTVAAHQGIASLQGDAGNARLARAIEEQRRGAQPTSPRGGAADGGPLARAGLGMAVQRAPAEGKHQRTDDFPEAGSAHKHARTDDAAESEGSSSEDLMEWAPTHGTTEQKSVNVASTRPKRYRRHAMGLPAPYQVESSQREARRAAELRMLDRIARILIAGLRSRGGEGATPHLAVALAGGALVVEGNSDRPVTAEQKAAAQHFLGTARQGQTPDSVPADDRRRFSKDARKVHAFTAGQYGAPLDDQWQGAFTKALSGGITWGALTVRGSQSRREAGHTEGSVHGEMTLLGRLVAEHARPGGKARGPASSVSAESVTPVHLGGFKKPCRACRWVIDAVNETVGKERGFHIVAPATHDNYYSHWSVPAWLLDSAYMNVFERVKKKAELSGQKFSGNKFTGDTKQSAGEQALESESDYS